MEILNLQHNALTGPIPPELGNLDGLWRLWLAKNDLTGPIPPELGNLDKLVHLSLGSNHLTGPIPPELGNLQALESLNVSDNQLSGPIPPELGTLTELQRVYLSGNLLTGALPLHFLGLEKLITLGCRSADSGACLPATGQFREWVQEVEVRGNVQLAVDMPFCNEIDAEALEALFDLANGPNWKRSEGWLEDEDLSGWYGVRTDSIGRVSSLDLRANGLSGHLPVALGHLTGMTALRIADNALSGRMPLSLSGVPLQEFDYGGTSLCAPDDAEFQDWLTGVPHLGGKVVPCAPLTDREILEGFHANVGRSGVIPGWLTAAPLGEWQGVATDAGGRVVELRLAGRDLRGSLPVEFAQLPELRVLDLGSNAFRGPIPPDLGDLDRLEVLNLRGNRLTGGIPSELGGLSELRHLALGWNRLSGPVPPELGELRLLERLDLARNRLSGDIPAELAQLSELRVLDLAHNALGGPIPPKLGELNHLVRLEIGSNRFRGSIPSAFGRLAAAEVIDLSDNQLNGLIPPQLGALRNLSELNLSDNRLTGAIPAELGGLSNLQALRLFGNDLTGSIPAALGGLADLATLNLGDNELSGPLPAEFGRAAKLENLDLRSNSLAGPVPSEFGNLTMLTSLILADNPDLVGPLPGEITGLDRLARFMAGGTGLCRPAGARFDSWFGTIPERRIVRCEGGASVYLTQTVQSWDDPVPLLAGEPALLRVFVTAPNGGAATMPDIQATFFVDGEERHTVHIPASTASIPHEVVQSDLKLSANSEIPASVIVPGLDLVIDVDPEGDLDSSLGVTKRIPDSGRVSVDVRRVPPFQLTLIPFLSGTEADSSVVQSVREIAADPGGHELVDGVRTLLPVGRIDVSAREPVISSAQGTYTLLAQVGAIRLMEGGSGHWMGVFGSPPPRGRASLGGWTSVSSPDARIIAHELGHNLSLQHAPCGFPAGVDPWFPYVSGNIGAWGYDLERGALVGPHSVDLMSYCTHGRYWISDYHYNRALDHRLASVRVEARALAFRTRSLMVWGGRDEDGVPYLDPAFVVEATPSFPPAGGEYTIEGSSSDGTPIFSYTFDMPVTADAEGQEASFVFTLPVEPGWGETLAHITLSGPGGSDSLDEKTDRSMAILRDPVTGQIRAFLSDYPNASLAQAAVGVAGAGVATPALEVLYSRGIPDAPAWNR